MSAEPAWSRDDRPSVEENAAAKMKADVAATRLNSRGTGNLPLDRERASFQLSEEQRHNRGTRPNSRRWRALNKIDEEIDTLTQRHAEAIGRIPAAEEALRQAPATDARTLAAWLSSGQRGDRPSATVYERQRDLDAARLLVNAVAVELDQKLEERLAHIERHRPKMLADAQHAVDAAREELLGKVNELPALRQALADAREVQLWCSHFPDPVESYGFVTAAALGLKAPIEKALGTTARVEYSALLAVLEEDAAALANAFSADQRKQLGQPDSATPVSTAMWDSDERAVAWRREELKRARQLGEFSSDLNRLADEARDFRT